MRGSVILGLGFAVAWLGSWAVGYAVASGLAALAGGA